jgi:serine/threonine-protein kinase
VQKAVAANPDERFQSVSELQDAVRGFLQGGLHLPRQAFARGSIIIREGEMGNAAYMIVSGSCRAFRATDGGQETLGTMKAGEVFGEMALLLDEPRSASVEAIDQVTVLVLDQSTMMTGLGFGGWTGALVRALAQRFRALERRERGPGSRS